MNKKVLYPIINIFLSCAFFLILFVIALVKSIEWNSYGMYGVSSFAPLFAVLVVAVLVIGIQATVFAACKKKGKLGESLALKLLVVPVAVIVGLFGIIDIVMPPVLDDATSGTILYEDVVYDWQGQHEALYERVELFKEKNGMDASVKYTDEEFQSVFRPLFTSMDKAYHGFNPLAIEMALDSPDMLEAILNGNFPIEVAATLILRTSDEQNGYDQNLTLEEILDKNISDVIGEVLVLVVGGEYDNAAINEAINNVLYTQLQPTSTGKDAQYIEWNIFNILGSNILFPEFDPNAQIVDINGNEMGACLGYQDMAWLDGIPLMFFIPLMSVRNIFYIFAALLGIAAAAQVYLALGYSRRYGTEFSFFMVRPRQA